jgi:hypothetical protein
MTFHPITAAPGSRLEPVLISVRTINGYQRGRLSLHPNFLRQIGWTDSAQIQPYIGSGEDTGQIRVKIASGRGLGLRRVRASCRLYIEFAIAGAPEKWKSSEPDFTVDTIGKSLTIRLPWSQKLRAIA